MTLRGLILVALVLGTSCGGVRPHRDARPHITQWNLPPAAVAEDRFCIPKGDDEPRAEPPIACLSVAGLRVLLRGVRRADEE